MGIKLTTLYVLLFAVFTSAESLHTRSDVVAFVDDLVKEYQFDANVINAVLDRAEVRQDIIDLITKPAERTMTWKEYRKIFITSKRVHEGIEFAQQNRDTLERAQREFDVPWHVIVSVIGVETSYGRIKGSFPVIDALVTLGFEYPPRASFFRDELKHFFILACEEHIRPFATSDACSLSSEDKNRSPVTNIRALEGSYAGAMGIGQFISSSYRRYAIDFDGDRFRDIWNNEADAIGSVANYFKVHNWRNIEPSLLEVSIDETDPKLVSMANQSLELSRTVSEWRELGVEVDIVDASQKAALFRFETENGTVYKLGFHDFYVITRYNRSRLYAAVVLELAHLIKSGS